MDDGEVIKELLKGAILRVSDAEETTIQARDDLPPKIRDCVDASRTRDAAHLERCPDCLEDAAWACLMDAASHRDDGNEADALALERQAEELRFKAAAIRRVADHDSQGRLE